MALLPALALLLVGVLVPGIVAPAQPLLDSLGLGLSSGGTPWAAPAASAIRPG